MANEKAAAIFESASRENRAIVAVILGSEECLWSDRVRQEILEDPLFLQNMGDEAAVWRVDLNDEAEEAAFRKKYQLQEIPAILLLDPRGKEFARLGYLPVDAKTYGATVRCLIEDFAQICLEIEEQNQSFDEEAWKGLYQKAKQLSTPYYKTALLERGVRQEKGLFFHLEKYRELLQNNKMKSPKVQKWKEKILEIDKKKELGARFQVAAMEFQKNLSGYKPGKHLGKVLKPLSRYVREFGKKDPNHYWQAELMIAEFLGTHNAVDLALQHAQISYAAAPDAMKQHIAGTITLIQRKKE